MEQLSQYSLKLLWPPYITLAIAVVGAVYMVLIGPRSGKRFGGAATWGEATFFLGAMFLYFVAWGSPLHLIGEEYLMMAHMATMLLVTTFAPPFVILGLPQSVVDWALGDPVVRRIVGFLTKPVLTLAFFSLSFFLWHVPALYDAAIRSLTIHLIQYGMLLLAGLMFWWPLLTKSTLLPRIRPVAIMGYTFGAIVMQTIFFGPIMTLDEPLYQSYKLVPRLISVTVLEDQQMGHLLMEVLSPAMLLIFFAMAFVKIARESGAPTRASSPPSKSA
jgi:putative membrane protein